MCVAETDGGAWSRVSVCEMFFFFFSNFGVICVRLKIKSPHLHSSLFAHISFLFLSFYLLLFSCVIKSAAVNLCTDIFSCWHSCENPQKHCEGFFNWILLAAHCFTVNIYRMKFLDRQIFPQVYYIGFFFPPYIWHLLIFSTMDAYQRWSFIFFICTFNFPQVDMREKKFVWMKLMKKKLNVRMFCIDFECSYSFMIINC